MICGDKAETVGHLFLQRFNLGVDKFDNTTTPLTDEMIVMAFVFDFFKARLPVGKVSLGSQTAFFEKLERAIHGRIADPWIDLADLIAQFFNTDMTVRVEKNLGDIFPLGGRFQALLFDPLLKGFQPVWSLWSTLSILLILLILPICH